MKALGGSFMMAQVPIAIVFLSHLELRDLPTFAKAEKVFPLNSTVERM